MPSRIGEGDAIAVPVPPLRDHGEPLPVERMKRMGDLELFVFAVVNMCS
jgi:hypothetical protein